MTQLKLSSYGLQFAEKVSVAAARPFRGLISVHDWQLIQFLPIAIHAPVDAS